MSSNAHCCEGHQVSAPSVCQTLDELEFERGIWSSAFYGDVEKLKFQLNKGTDPSICDASGYTALHYAARNDRESACSLLLERGAKVDAQTPGGATPLLRAASQGHGNIVLLLLRYKADATLCDSDGRTPLHKAAEGSHAGVVKILLKHKTDLKYIKDNKGHPPVFYVRPEWTEILSLLS